MILNVRDIPEGHSNFPMECDLGSVKNDLPPLVGKLQCQVDANRLDANIFLQIHYSGLFVLQCARCLEDFNSQLSGDVRITIRETSDRHGMATDDETVDFYYDINNDNLDVSSALFDEIMIETPIMPLCSKDCKGVEVRNKDIIVDIDGVKKDSTQIDPRWEALRKLKSNT